MIVKTDGSFAALIITAVCIILVNMQIIALDQSSSNIHQCRGGDVFVFKQQRHTARSCRQSKDNALKTPADEVLQRSGSRVDNPPPAELLHVATNTTYSLQTVITSSHYRDDIRLSDLQLMIVCAEYTTSTEHQWPVASLSSHKTIWSHNLQITGCWLLLPTSTPQHHYTCTQASCGTFTQHE